MQTPIKRLLESMNNPKAENLKTKDWIEVIKILCLEGDEKINIMTAYNNGKNDALDNIHKTSIDYCIEKHNL